MWAVNPRLIYARGQGQGQIGPDADLGGFDAVSYWSRGGIGHMLTPSEGPFIMQRGAMGDAPSGAFLAGGVGGGTVPTRAHRQGMHRRRRIARLSCWTLAVDLVPTSILQHDPVKSTNTALSSPLVGPYLTADQRWIVLNMLDADRHWPAACRALGLDEYIHHPDYKTTALRAANNEAIHEVFRARLVSLPFDEAVRRLKRHDTIFAALATPMEVLVDPQVVANGFLPRHPDHEACRLASGPVQFDSTQTVVHHGAPAIGEHTESVLRELGLTETELAVMRTAGAFG